MFEHPSADLEVFADHFSFPTSLTFDDQGALYLAESGLPFGGATKGGKIWRLDARGERELIAEQLRQPITGLTFHQGELYVSEGGHPSRISRIHPQSGVQTTILENLPGPGNYHTNMVVFGADGKLYFSQGAMTNMGVVGLDAYELGWLRRLPHEHDIPGYDIVLSGVNIETPNPAIPERGERVQTGTFASFGTTIKAGTRLTGQLPCTSAIMRCNLDGSELELVCWGIRNAFALGFLPDGRLLAIDQGADDRGSRPIGNAPDLLFEVREGAWYGWPDFIGDIPVTDPQFKPTRGPDLTFILQNHAELPPPEKPLLSFPPHVAAVKFDTLPANYEPYGGQLIVTLFGDEAPMTAPAGPRVGRGLTRIDPADWSLHPFLHDPLARPIDAKFDPQGHALYIVDFGQFEMKPEGGVDAVKQSGKIWRLPLKRG